MEQTTEVCEYSASNGPSIPMKIPYSSFCILKLKVLYKNSQIIHLVLFKYIFLQWCFQKFCHITLEALYHQPDSVFCFYKYFWLVTNSIYITALKLTLLTSPNSRSIKSLKLRCSLDIPSNWGMYTAAWEQLLNSLIEPKNYIGALIFILYLGDPEALMMSLKAYINPTADT